jgi:hypothetical protein
VLLGLEGDRMGNREGQKARLTWMPPDKVQTACVGLRTATSFHLQQHNLSRLPAARIAREGARPRYGRTITLANVLVALEMDLEPNGFAFCRICARLNWSMKHWARERTTSRTRKSWPRLGGHVTRSRRADCCRYAPVCASPRPGYRLPSLLTQGDGELFGDPLMTCSQTCSQTGL